MERELKKVGVTIHHMCEQYIALNHEGYRSSQFGHHYKTWGKPVNLVIHMNHKAGDTMYMVYAGKTLSIIDKDMGEIKGVQFFVVILGASQYTYAKVSRKPQKEEFVTSVENAMRFF